VEERQCGDHVYQVSKFGAMKGFTLQARLARVIGPGIQTIAATGSEAAAVGAMVGALPPEELLAIALEFATVSKVVLQVQSAAGVTLMPQPLAPMFDSHFVDRYDELLEFLVFAAVVNFGKSFTRGKGLGLRLAAIVQPFASQATSNGSGSASSAGAATT
jgi:hypothetical protein